MPELPEVETIRLGLQKYIVGKTIEDVEVRLRRIFSGDEKNIIGAKITSIDRFGKGLVINLDNNYSIAAHIKLTGQFVYRDDSTLKLKLSAKVGSQIPNKFTHVTFKLDKGAYLHYNDIRQFGWIKILKTEDLKTIPFFKDLGPEPFGGLTFEIFKNIISKNNTAIKPLIMDQKKIGGIGNIYANDALFDSQIDPRKKAKSLKEKEIKSLYNSILKVLKNGLENGGASELNYVNALGQEGKYQHHFLAYARDGEKCLRCGTIMKKITLGGRGTYFCPNCQK
ncbi:MAG: DNA-formamidopyrimidine glycosylase [Candidatus Levybacteria bacterium RIFCSPHIGHO2_02_FULL_37_13]|nr:MAG: DNA-formamidopyrimidine glycosylase [Candidatus Levybacteria bacterium RIFCSPHIGHO2_02_FULL_37_13]OGH39391.1 MAG: DNA-formamidopyrimidine glycosylase [Candidatus Levybacteria bacterium RIFCSPLOWO2_01_FULL_37_26]